MRLRSAGTVFVAIATIATGLLAHRFASAESYYPPDPVDGEPPLYARHHSYSKRHVEPDTEDPRPEVHDPPRVGTRRFFLPYHEFGTFYGVGGLLARDGESRYPQLVGFHYGENEGELGEALVFGVPRLLGIHDDYRRGRSDTFGMWLSMDAVVPGMFGRFEDRAFTRGFDFAFGLSTRTSRSSNGPSLLQIGVRIAFLWADVPFQEGALPPGIDAPSTPGEHREKLLAAMDALSIRFHKPLSRSISGFAQWDGNLYALFRMGDFKKWLRPSPFTFGLHWDIEREVYVRAEMSINTFGGDRALGTRASLGIRF